MRQDDDAALDGAAHRLAQLGNHGADQAQGRHPLRLGLLLLARAAVEVNAAQVGGLEALQHRFYLLVARGHLGLIDIVQFQGLRQGEDVLLPVVADHGRAEGLGRGLAARVAVGRQGVRIALAGHQSPEDA